MASGEHAEPHEAVAEVRRLAHDRRGHGPGLGAEERPGIATLTASSLPGDPFAQAAGLGPAVVVNVPVTIFVTVNEPLAF